MLSALVALSLFHGQLPADTARFRVVLDSIVPALMSEHGVPGAALVIVSGDSTLALRGWGLSDREANRAVDPNRTVFRLASVAKLFVAATVLQQVAGGRLDLQADLRALLPEIPIQGGGDSPVRLHDLLTHTGGFEERVIGMATVSAAGVIPLDAYLARRMPRRDAAPGVRTSYSNHGFALAGLAVERASGRSFAENARDALFLPLGMTRTAYRQPVGDSTDLATGYRCREGECQVAPPALTHTYPAGLAWSTAADMGQFLRLMLGVPPEGAGSVLDAASVAAMQREQFTHDPTLEGMGYGFWRHRWRTGELLLSHAGNVPGYVALVQLAPDRRLGFFLATNGNSAVFPRLVSEALLAALLPGERRGTTVQAVAAGPVAEFAGTYRLIRTARRSVETFPTLFLNPITLQAVGDTLVVHRTSGPVRFLRTGALQFQSQDGVHRVAFRRGSDGRIALFLAGQPAFGGEFPAAYERLAWHDTPHFMNEYVSWLAMLPVLLLLMWGLVGGAGKYRRRLGFRSTRTAVPGYAVVLGLCWAVGFLAFGFGFIARSTRLMAGPLVYGLTPLQQAVAQAPWLLGVVAILLLRTTWTGWQDRWRWSGLVCLSGLTLTAVATMTFLVRWGYLPARW